jgi:hypothetical protein
LLSNIPIRDTNVTFLLWVNLNPTETLRLHEGFFGDNEGFLNVG